MQSKIASQWFPVRELSVICISVLGDSLVNVDVDFSTYVSNIKWQMIKMTFIPLFRLEAYSLVGLYDTSQKSFIWLLAVLVHLSIYVLLRLFEVSFLAVALFLFIHIISFKFVVSSNTSWFFQIVKSSIFEYLFMKRNVADLFWNNFN